MRHPLDSLESLNAIPMGAAVGIIAKSKTVVAAVETAETAVAAKAAVSAAKEAEVIGSVGIKSVAIAKDALQEALAVAKPTSSHPKQLMATLEDGTRVIFRKDFGEQAHAVGGPYKELGKVDHYNIEVQSARGKTIENIHAVPDGVGGFKFWGKDGVVK